MSICRIRSAAVAFTGAAAALWVEPAYPHAVCGARIFPATLAIDAAASDRCRLLTLQPPAPAHLARAWETLLEDRSTR